jgi:hypothetical protein
VGRVAADRKARCDPIELDDVCRRLLGEIELLRTRSQRALVDASKAFELKRESKGAANKRSYLRVLKPSQGGR